MTNRVATQILTFYFYVSEKKTKKYKKEENPKISCYRGKIEQIENLTVNAGSNRTNWKSRTSLKKARKLRDDFEFCPWKTSINGEVVATIEGDQKKP